MEQKLNVLGTLNAIYMTMKKVHVAGDEDVIAMSDCFRALSTVIQKMAADQKQAEEDAAKRAAEETAKKKAEEMAKVPPHKRKADGENPVE